MQESKMKIYHYICGNDAGQAEKDTMECEMKLTIVTRRESVARAAAVKRGSLSLPGAQQPLNPNPTGSSLQFVPTRKIHQHDERDIPNAFLIKFYTNLSQ